MLLSKEYIPLLAGSNKASNPTTMAAHHMVVEPNKKAPFSPLTSL
jgi:hypothetical protein